MNKHCLTAILLGCLWMPLGAYAAQTCNTGMLESTKTGDFSFGSNGTVTHNATGLVWKRCLEGQTFSDGGTPTLSYSDDTCTGTVSTFTWTAALTQAQMVNTSGFAGSNDWRVPTLKELRSTVEYCRAGVAAPPASNLEVFPSSTTSFVWSSSPVVNDTATASSWVVNFGNGSDDWMSRGNAYPVRLVRGGL